MLTGIPFPGGWQGGHRCPWLTPAGAGYPCSSAPACPWPVGWAGLAWARPSCRRDRPWQGISSISLASASAMEAACEALRPPCSATGISRIIALAPRVCWPPRGAASGRSSAPALPGHFVMSLLQCRDEPDWIPDQPVPRPAWLVQNNVMHWCQNPLASCHVVALFHIQR